MTNRRGALLAINSAFNKPTTKFGVDYQLLELCLFVSVAAFLLAAKIVALSVLPMLILWSAMKYKFPHLLRDAVHVV